MYVTVYLIDLTSLLSTVGRYESENDRYVTYHTVIPYTKLFVEHKVITAFSRYTGKVFAVALGSYYLFKVRSSSRTLITLTLT
jgi:hypothetical protein